MSREIVEQIRVIDTDSHISEPEDLWTSRVSVQRWGDLVPHVRRDLDRGEDVWWWAGAPGTPTGLLAAAGWPEYPPAHPPTLAEADAGSWDPVARLKRMDEYGIYGQVLYPNIGGLGSGNFLALKEPDLMLACAQAYNDFLADFVSVAPERLIGIMALPFWDLKASLAEVERAAALGLKGILFCGDPDRFGQPFLADPYWNPLWSLAQDMGLPVNFHVGNSDTLEDIRKPRYENAPPQSYFAALGANMFLSNARHIIEVVMSGICHRYPGLNIVSVESGVGWIPFILEALDWQWDNLGVHREHPDWGLKPSEYFHRQIYGCFWFEKASLKAAIAMLGPDNLLYETDYPHPTSMSPGPASAAMPAKEYIARTLDDLPDDTLRKVLHDNAARIYHLE